MRNRDSCRRGGRGERGATAVEFALVVPLLLVLVFGVIQYGLYFWSAQMGTSATGQAVRRLSVGDCQDPAQLRSFLASRMGPALVGAADDVTVDLDYPEAVGGEVTLAVSFPVIDLHFPFVPMPAGGRVTREFSARVEDVTATVDGCPT